MKRLILLLTLLACMIFGNPADAGQGLHIGGLGGLSKANSVELTSSGGGAIERDLDFGYGFGAFVGYDFAGPWRMET